MNIIILPLPCLVYMGILFTEEHIKAMREWVADCQWNEDPEDIEQLSNLSIVIGVQKHYEGGLKAFMIASNFELKYENPTTMGWTGLL